MLYNDPVRDEENYYRNMNLLLAPLAVLRFFASLSRMMIFTVLCILAAPFYYYGWIIGIGPYSRDARYANLREQSPSMKASTVVTLDLAHRDKYSREDGHKNATASLIGYPAEYQTTDLRYSMCQTVGGELSLETVPYSFRDREWFIRQGNRLERDLITGASNMAALRYTLTAMKVGIEVVDRSPMVYSEKDDFCHVDPDNLPTATLQLWIKTSYALNLDGAPNVQYVMADNSHRWHQASKYVLWGACLVSECPLVYRLYPYVGSSLKDLYATQPPLSPDQQNVEDALLATGDNNYWLRMAHSNGITDDNLIMDYARRQRDDLEVQLSSVDKTLDRYEPPTVAP